VCPWHCGAEPLATLYIRMRTPVLRFFERVIVITELALPMFE